jgi:aromatic ring-opening dioxygenase catalytic subunit (LigB family)
MSLVFAGICSHAPGIIGRAAMCDASLREPFHAAYHRLREQLLAARPEALVVVAAEHFANFFMNNMPAFAIGVADRYSGPIEDPAWLGIARTTVPGNAALSQQLIREVMQSVDVAFAEEWRLDHGIMVPLHFLTPRYDLPIVPVNINCQGPPLTPLHRAWAFGEALRRAADGISQRIAIIGTGGISHWPATPDSGKINEAWDRELLDRWTRNDKAALLAYSDADTYRDAGQGGFEMRTFISIAAAARGRGHVQHYTPIPIFAVGCTIAVMDIAA